MKKVRIIVVILFMFCTNLAQAQTLRVFEEIPGRSPSDHYTCRVKLESEDDDAWRDVFVLQTEAKDNGDRAYYEILRGWTASWMAFESDFEGGNVVVEISKKDGTAITEAIVRPAAHPSEAVISEGKAYVTFSEPTNVNVDINGQMEKTYTGFGYEGPDIHTISLFANPLFRIPDAAYSNVKVLQPDEDIRDLNRSEWDTLVLAPGIHEIVDTVFEIHSNEVLYIPGDAIYKGTIHPKQAWGSNASTDFMVYGSGTVSTEHLYRDPDDDDNKTVKPFTYQAVGAHLEGFVVADPPFHTFNMGHAGGDISNINVYKNLKILAWRRNSDGINAFRYSEVSDCFFRVQDDAFYLGSVSVNQHDNVVWNDANGAVLFLPRAEDASTCTFKNVTVIYQRAQWHWWDGGRIVSMRQTVPGSTYNNIHVQNILVEDPLPAFPPFYANVFEGDGDLTVNNFLIENVRQEHDGVSSSLDEQRGKPQNTLLGLDENRQWENITFKNCYFNGTWLRSFEDGNFKTEFIDKQTVTFDVSETFPVADFEADVTVALAGEPVQFTDLTSNDPETWEWSFPGARQEVSTERNPLVIYDTPGVYDVSLSVSNFNGSDAKKKNEFITVEAVLSTTYDSQNFKVYPNPTGEVLTLVLPDDEVLKMVRIFTLEGTLILEQATTKSLSINLDALNYQGLALVHIISGEQRASFKVFIEK